MNAGDFLLKINLANEVKSLSAILDMYYAHKISITEKGKDMRLHIYKIAAHFNIPGSAFKFNIDSEDNLTFTYHKNKKAPYQLIDDLLSFYPRLDEVIYDDDDGDSITRHLYSYSVPIIVSV